MPSEIQEFFKKKTIFLTGGTGFLGRVIIEKLLRTTELERIYALFRAKRGLSITERLLSWRKDPVFAELLRMKPEALEKVTPIAGDCLQQDLVISKSDQRLLISQVQVVIHSAAVIRPDEALHMALATNVRATRRMLELAKQMIHLVSFVHVSSAYSQLLKCPVEERFYPEHLSCSSDRILAVADLLGDELLDKLTTVLVGSFSNTCLYTKALAEDVIQREADGLPLCVLRSGFIMSTYKEPLIGWTGHVSGLLGLLVPILGGVMRVTQADRRAHFAAVPADFSASMVLGCAWKTAKNLREQGKSPTIYTLAPSQENPLSFGTLMDCSLSQRDRIPPTKMMWYPFLLCFSSGFFYQLATFFLHILPGYCLDTLLRLQWRESVLLNLYERIHKNISELAPFCNYSWNFRMDNTRDLIDAMCEQDRQLYDFDMGELDWQDYFRCVIEGMRLYVAKDLPTAESYGKGLRLKKRLKIQHYVCCALLVSAIGYVLWQLAEMVIESYF
ncbi:fatty acyl-CoA reductase wat-like [Drosophila kikkawai]|uniref:Fatty acyl-CoA reductase n=1 Tax=Drosophila kikkawai TaxID=30033 RepID=A0A6P4J5T7_DROKI|nr:fatty acyl-CoA reductase wat-like [Drosophila kikkawai]